MLVTVIFLFYLGLMLWIGIAAYRHTGNLSDYLLGGRHLGAGATALSASASDMGSWLLLGLPGIAMTEGFGAFWLVIGLLSGAWLNWLYVAQRLRRYSQNVESALTLSSFLSRRFQDNSGSLRVISALFILFFFMLYTSSGLIAGGKLLETAFDIDYSLAVFAVAGVIVTYTVMGGYLAVSWTDVAQALFIVAVLILIPVSAINDMGGLENSLANITSRNPELLNMFTQPDGSSITLIGTLSLLGWGLGYFGQPHILARFKGIDTPEKLPSARRISIIWMGFSMAGACLVGLVAIGHLPYGLTDRESVFMVLVDALFHPAVSALLVVAILAAVMSSADSQLLVSGSALTEDLYRAVFNRKASQKQLIIIARYIVVTIAVIATVMALNKGAEILSLVSFAWAGCGAAFGPVVVLSLYWKRMTRSGAIAGILVGVSTVVLWRQQSGGWFDLYEIIPGIVLASIAIFSVSLLTARPSTEVEQSFDRMESELTH